VVHGEGATLRRVEPLLLRPAGRKAKPCTSGTFAGGQEKTQRHKRWVFL
jgi:hypothetical protein